jgi:GMP synthase PP-ATPase subunit
MTEMSGFKILCRANEIVGNHKLEANFLEGVRAVGVQGDNRVYLPVMVLRGPFPGWEILGELSTQITNELPISHVTYDITPGHGFAGKVQSTKQEHKKQHK